jgi:hypothetical protein
LGRNCALDKSRACHSLWPVSHHSHSRSHRHPGRDQGRPVWQRYALPAVLLLVIGACTLDYGGGILVMAVLLAAAGYVAFSSLIHLTWAAGRDAAKVFNFLRAEAGRADLERTLWQSHRARYEQRQLARVRQIRDGHRTAH